jgi:hypothetical protein
MNKQQKRSGLTIIEFCRDNKINVSTFYAWRHRLSDKIYSWLKHLANSNFPLIAALVAFCHHL